MIEFLKGIFGLKKKKKQKQKPNPDYQTHDIIDYDGMGNQGRFPPKK
jgi:hypothetical protein